MYTFRPSSEKWVKVKRGLPATEKQQQLLVKLGWGRDDLTIIGASHLIDAILFS